MTYSIKHLFHIDASRQHVFKAITTIEGLSNWWTVQTQGSSGLGEHIQFDFGDYTGPQMKVTELIANEKVVWECVANNDGWLGHTFVFSLDENEGKTRIRFSQNGWPEQGDFYASCCFSWGRYMESLRQYCQSGRGEAYGSEGYR
jgi:uncharacterized protein YndB with AHSA1/START domain